MMRAKILFYRNFIVRMLCQDAVNEVEIRDQSNQPSSTNSKPTS